MTEATTLYHLEQIIKQNNLTDIINIKKDETQPGRIIIICKKDYNKKQIKKITEFLSFGIDYEIISNDF